MDRKSDFLEKFQSELDAVALPEAVTRVCRLESCLSQEARDAVWLVRSREDNRQLVLRISGEDNLQEEFAAMRRLPEDLEGRVPRAVDFFEEDGTQYLLRTYLPGKSLAAVREEEAWSERRTAELGRELCALLDRLHRLSPPIIHRDIKPENIILSPEGLPCLIDFGIARSYDPQRDTDTTFMGTRSTAAPEQYGFTQSDQRTDLYALGVTLRWLVTGSYRPEALDTAPCSRKMRRFLQKATAFNPADRFPSAQSMGSALGRLTTPPWRRALPVLAACLLTVLLAAWGWRVLENRTVEFTSPLLEEAVRVELRRPEGRITRADLNQVRRLAVVGGALLGEEQDYQYRLCAYVDGQQVQEAPPGDISDLSLLSQMPNLTTLYLCNQADLSDLSPLKGLPLRNLYLCDNQIRELSPLGELRDLETLYIAGNPWTDLSPLASLENLRRLNLDSWDFGRPIDSLEPLAGLKLESLSAGNLAPAGRDWEPLARLENLDTLWLWDPPEEALEALGRCASLRSLHLGNLSAPDASGLPVVPRLAELCFYSRLPSLEGIQKQTGLLQVSLCNQPDMDLSPLTALEHLQAFYVHECPISDFGPLGKIGTLQEVHIQEANRQVLEATCPGGSFQIIVN